MNVVRVVVHHGGDDIIVQYTFLSSFTRILLIYSYIKICYHSKSRHARKILWFLWSLDFMQSKIWKGFKICRIWLFFAILNGKKSEILNNFLPRNVSRLRIVQWKMDTWIKRIASIQAPNQTMIWFIQHLAKFSFWKQKLAMKNLWIYHQIDFTYQQTPCTVHRLSEDSPEKYKENVWKKNPCQHEWERKIFFYSFSFLLLISLWTVWHISGSYICVVYDFLV